MANVPPSLNALCKDSSSSSSFSRLTQSLLNEQKRSVNRVPFSITIHHRRHQPQQHFLLFTCIALSLCVTTCPFLAFGHLLGKYLSTLLPFSTICMIFGFILMGLLFYLHTYLVIQSHLQHLINQHAAEKCKDLTHCDFCLISK